MAVYLALAAAAALQGTAAPANPVTAELARLISPAYISGFGVGRPIGDIETALEQQMLNSISAKGPMCDPDVPECRAAASRIAKRRALEIVRLQKQLAEDYVASILSDLSASEQKDALVFLTSKQGAAFASKLPLLVNPMADPQRAQRMAERAASTYPSPTLGMFDEFYDATASLPRAKPRLVPAPMPRPAPPTGYVPTPDKQPKQ